MTLLDADLGMANTGMVAPLLGMAAPRAAVIDAVVGSSCVGSGARAGSLAGLRVECLGIQVDPRVGGGGADRGHAAAVACGDDRWALVVAVGQFGRGADRYGGGRTRGVTSFVRAADVAMVAVTPEPTSIADAYAMVKCLTDAGRMRENMPRVMLVVNQAAG